jgi:hypothetical protein
VRLARQDYYFYLASNWRSTGGVHIDMESYEKIYDLKSKYTLPTRIFLDKGTMYNFTIFLTATGTSFYMPDELGLCTGQVKAPGEQGAAPWGLMPWVHLAKGTADVQSGGFFPPVPGF